MLPLSLEAEATLQLPPDTTLTTESALVWLETYYRVRGSAPQRRDEESVAFADIDLDGARRLRRFHQARFQVRVEDGVLLLRIQAQYHWTDAVLSIIAALGVVTGTWYMSSNDPQFQRIVGALFGGIILVSGLATIPWYRKGVERLVSRLAQEIEPEGSLLEDGAT